MARYSTSTRDFAGTHRYVGAPKSRPRSIICRRVSGIGDTPNSIPRVIVRPLTPADEVQRHVDTATAEVQQQNREQAVVRDVTRPAQRPPQADQDLKGGIQTRNLDRLLRR